MTQKYIKQIKQIAQKNFLQKAFICTFLLSTLFFSNLIQSEEILFSDRTDVQDFINNMVHKHQFQKDELTTIFSNVVPEPKIIKAISKPHEALPWYKYQEKLVTNDRVEKGVQFWQENAASLNKASEQFGVPPEIIVAIIGIESLYGEKKGKWPVIQALSTLAFDYPPRSKFFRKELEEFLLLVREQGFDALSILGSYAGAIGSPQFMPSSYRRYAIKFAGQSQSDLVNNMDDVIGSVANYFHVYGWKSGESIAHQAKVSGDKYKLVNTADRKNPKPTFSIKKLAKYGISPKQSFSFKHDPLAAFITLETADPDQNEYWLTLHNFYVITRYNPSTLYGMAVFQLSERIKASRNNR